MSSVRMSMQDIKFKMILLCLKSLIVFPIISSAPWNFIAWIYRNLSKCTPQHWRLDALPLNSESFLLLHEIQRKMPLFPTMQKISGVFLKRGKSSMVLLQHMSTDQEDSRLCSGLCVLRVRAHGHQQGGCSSFLCLSLVPSCFLPSGEEEQRGATGSLQALATEGGIRSLSRIACRLGSSCQKECMSKGYLPLPFWVSVPFLSNPHSLTILHSSHSLHMQQW